MRACLGAPLSLADSLAPVRARRTFPRSTPQWPVRPPARPSEPHASCVSSSLLLSHSHLFFLSFPPNSFVVSIVKTRLARPIKIGRRSVRSFLPISASPHRVSRITPFTGPVNRSFVFVPPRSFDHPTPATLRFSAFHASQQVDPLLPARAFSPAIDALPCRQSGLFLPKLAARRQLPAGLHAPLWPFLEPIATFSLPKSRRLRSTNRPRNAEGLRRSHTRVIRPPSSHFRVRPRHL